MTPLAEQLLEDILNELRSQSRGGAGGPNTGVPGVGPGGPGIVSKAFDKLKETALTAANGLTSLASAATDGAAGISQVTSVMTNMATAILPKFGGVMGILTNVVQTAASVTEVNIKTQQELGRSGASFGGSLTQMRQAAGAAYLGLSDFAAIVKNNSDVFSTMSGNVQDGVKAFTSVQNTLLKPGTDTSRMLASLGVSSQEAAELTASFMRSQGTMNKAQLQDNKAVASSVAKYAQELTVLSSLTGQSREAIQKELDAKNKEAQFQAYLASLAPEEAKKLQQGIRMAMLQGGEGAVDAFQAMAMGFPPLTEAGQLYAATQAEGMAALEKYNAVTKDSTITADEASKMNKKTLAEQIAASKGNLDSMREVLQASSLQGGALAKNAAATTALVTKFKDMNAAEIEAAIDRMEKEASAADKTGKAKATEASAAADMQKRFQELTNQLLEKMMPAMNYLLSMVDRTTQFFGKFSKAFLTVIEPLGPPITRIVDLLTNAFGGGIESLTAEDGPMMKLRNVIEKYLVPAITWTTDWFVETFKNLGKSADLKDFFSRLWDRLSVLGNQIVDVIGPPLKKFWNDTAKPMIADVFKNMIDWFIATLRKNSRIARFLFNETDSEKEERKKMEDDDIYQGILRQKQAEQAQLAPEYQTGVNYDSVKEEWEKQKEKLLVESKQKSEYEESMRRAMESYRPRRDNGTLGATGKLFENFGPKTTVDLHGTEGVITPTQLSDMVTSALQQKENNQVAEQLNQLNNLTQQLLAFMKQTAENTRNNVDATKNLSGDLFS